MKIIKNRAILITLIIVVLSFVLLALPGQFAHFGVEKFVPRTTYKYNLSGYQWMFGTVKNSLDNAIGSAVGSGIAAFVILILVFVGLFFCKKSSFVSLLVSLALITVAILFFSSSAATAKAYSEVYVLSEKGDFTNMSWVPYVIASLTLIGGGIMMYRTVLVMKEEVKRPSQGKGPSYSYLHK